MRQAIAKGIVAFYQKYVDEQSKRDIKETLVQYDRSLLVADPRRCEPKKFGGRGAREPLRSRLARVFPGARGGASTLCQDFPCPKTRGGRAATRCFAKGPMIQ